MQLKPAAPFTALCSRVFGLALALMAGTALAESNTVFLVDTGTSNTTDYVLGRNGTNNVLIVTNGATLQNAGSGYIATNVNSKYNHAYISGIGSFWSNEDLLFVGYRGDYNSLTISRTGRVSAVSGISLGLFGADSTTVWVASGGVLTNGSGASTTVGANANYNKLIITNGGIVYAGQNAIINGSGSDKHDNEISVIGTGSYCFASRGLILGSSASNNYLTVSDGGSVCIGSGTNGNTIIGEQAGAHDNTALVTGYGSVLSNNLDINLGFLGSSNSMTASAGGRIMARSTWIGVSSHGNKATVSGAGSVWSNSDILTVGSNGMGNRLTVSDGGYIITSNGFMGYGSASSNNLIAVSGAGSILSNTMFFVLGNNGGSNTVVVSEGGKFSAYTMLVGEGSGSDNNSVNVTGTNSLIKCTQQLYIGDAATTKRNSLIVSNGAMLDSWFVFLGSTGSDSNTITATGNGSVITGDYFYAGISGNNNCWYVTNGATIYSREASVGRNAGSDGNAVRIDGSGSRWISPDFWVGYSGASNSLSLYNGGKVEANNSYIGYDAGNSNNGALVAGLGSLWTNVYDLHVGNTGSANNLVIANGGRVVNSNAYIGTTNGAVNNWALVAGPGSLWSNQSALDVGYYGASNTLTVSDTGSVVMAAGGIGTMPGADRNRIIVRRGGLLRVDPALFYVGNYGISNNLTIQEGGLVAVPNNYMAIGYQMASSNNSVSVNGSGSLLNIGISYMLKIGLIGDNNSLTVTNGGTVISGSSFIGENALSRGNWARVTGNGSVFSNSGTLYIGYEGQYGRLEVLNGGSAVSRTAIIGYYGAASSNTALINGIGSCWSNQEMLIVGDTGAVSSLTIANRGNLYSGDLIVGAKPASSNNAVSINNSIVTVTGICNIIRGTNTFDGDVMRVGALLLTNSAGRMIFRSGMLYVGNSVVSNNNTFFIGSGTASATNMLVNNGTHYYANGLVIETNCALAGNGTVFGPTAQLMPGARLSPGESTGTLTISNLAIVGGTYVFEKSAASADLVNVPGTLTFGALKQLTVRLVDLGGASFVGTNTLINYAALSGTPDFIIDYGTTGLAGYSITNNAAAKRIELKSPPIPAVPEALPGSAITTNSFTANWSTSANATNYLLDVATDSGFAGFVPGYNGYLAGNVTSANVGGLLPDSAHYYRVRAQGLGGTSANSATIPVTTLPMPPASAPDGVSATKGAFNDRVRITWNAVSNATVYEVWRNTANDSSGAAPLPDDPTSIAFDDMTVTVGTNYYYWVKAKNNGGTSAFSVSDYGYAASSVAAPSAPSGVSATKGAFPNKVVITWNVVTNAAYYEVWRHTANESSSALILSTGLLLPVYADPTVTAQTAYYYWVKAVNGAGAGAFSASDMGFASASGDIRWLPLAGDFDGDRLADPTVYQPSTGTWRARLSSANYLTISTTAGFFGGTNYAGLAADFDGDLLADPAVYSAPASNWVVKLSSTGYQVQIDLPGFLGGLGWEAVASDFDGDLLADPAVQEPATGSWIFTLSSANYLAIPKPDFMGTNGWTALASDFDGDRLADPAVYNKATGLWSIRLTSAQYLVCAVIELGGSGWLPVAGDFDGDGFADPAVYNPLDGHWILWLSSAHYATIDLQRFLGGME